MTEHLYLQIKTYVDHSSLYGLDEIAAILGAPRPFLERVVDEEIIRPAEPGPRFNADQLREFERMLRLHEDLGVNWAGVAIIHDLLERLTRLEAIATRKSRGEGDARDATCD